MFAAAVQIVIVKRDPVMRSKITAELVGQAEVAEPGDPGAGGTVRDADRDRNVSPAFDRFGARTIQVCRVGLKRHTHCRGRRRSGDLLDVSHNVAPVFAFPL